MEQSADCDRQHEDIDREHVEREQPHRLAYVLFVDVFHDCDLKLSGQEQDREHREDGEPDPARVASAAASERGEKLRHLWIGGGAAEDVTEPVVEHERDEHADGEERHQLDDRFEGDRRHHALVAFRGIQVACAEGDGERGQQQRHVERGVGQHGHDPDVGRHHDVRVLHDDGEAAGYGL